MCTLHTPRDVHPRCNTALEEIPLGLMCWASPHASLEPEVQEVVCRVAGRYGSQRW
jgi:hypothetical protein